MTSSPPSSGLSPAVCPESPSSAGNWTRGLRSLRDLTQHLTTRADDNHAPPVCAIPISPSPGPLAPCQGLVRFFALRRIKPHTPPLVRAPVNSFEFHTCVHTPQAEDLLRLLQHRVSPTLSPHRLRRGLLGYLILFAPHAFVPQRQLQARRPPSPLVFLHISTHFTATHGIPPSSPVLQLPSFQGSPWLSHGLLPRT